MIESFVVVVLVGPREKLFVLAFGIKFVCFLFFHMLM